MTFKTIALFGANGQIGTCILRALLASKKLFRIVAIVPPETPSPEGAKNENVTVKEIDLLNAKRQDVARALSDVDVVVSALNGKALEAQYVIQDAAADAGVQRFYPSEYGFHHIYRKPGDDWGYMHPVSD
jgi:putative NADH-flavin reductase